MRLYGIWFAILVALPGRLSAQDKETLWTEVTAKQDRLLLRWDKRHPWINDFGSGRGLELVGRYRGENGQAVTETIATGSVDGKAREAEFALTDRLRRAVHSPICLSLRMSGRAIPIRRANRGDRDTAGFRYPVWELRQRQQAKVDSVRRIISELEGKLETVRNSIQNQKRIIEQFGWSAYPRCEEMPAKAPDVTIRPRTVVDPEQQAEAAAKVCVYRVWTAQVLWEHSKAEVSKEIHDARLRIAAVDPKFLEKARKKFCGLFAFANDLPDVAQAVLQREGAEQLLGATMVRQAEQFAREWKQHRTGIAKYVPQFGGETDYLDLPAAAVQASCRRNGPALAKELDLAWLTAGVSQEPQDLLGWIGGLLDSYSTCSDDTRKGLAIEYEKWVVSERMAPRRAAMRHVDLVKMCRKDQETLKQLTEQQSTFESSIRAARAELQSAEQLPGLPAKAVVLNHETCSAK